MRNKQSVAIAALIIAIIGLSIGFAAFSNTLTIRSSADVHPDASNMRVVFSTSTSSETAGDINPSSATYGGTANINSGDHTILENIHATFTAPGQSVTYSTNLYVYNAGTYQAQLSGITFKNATDSQTYKKCTIKTTDINGSTLESADLATQSLVDAACNGITISVTIGESVGVTPTSTAQEKTLGYQTIDVGGYLPASVTISYTGENYVDGPMHVAFGDIAISATSAVDETRIPVNPWKETRGMTSSNVKFNRSYVPQTASAGLPSPVILYSNGGILQGISLSSTDIDNAITNEQAKVGSNYYIAGDGYGNYNLVEFDSPTTAHLYIAPTSVAATYEDLTPAAVKAGKTAEYIYVLSNN